MYFDNIKKKRRTRTIPFGYKLSGNYLLPISSEITSYENIKKEILLGKLSLRQASKKIENETGRKLSHSGLKIILNKDIPKWNESAKKARFLIRKKYLQKREFENEKIKEKNYLLKLELIKQKKKEAEREKSLKPKQCKICGNIKKYFDFKGYGRGPLKNYCKVCYKKLLEKNPEIYMICRRCKKNKNISKFIGLDFFKAYQYRICLICERERRKEWILKNPEKSKIIRNRYLTKNRVILNKKQLEYQRKNKDKLSTVRLKNYKLLRKDIKNYSKYLINKRRKKLFESEIRKEDYEKW